MLTEGCDTSDLVGAKLFWLHSDGPAMGAIHIFASTLV